MDTNYLFCMSLGAFIILIVYLVVSELYAPKKKTFLNIGGMIVEAMTYREGKENTFMCFSWHRNRYKMKMGIPDVGSLPEHIVINSTVNFQNLKNEDQEVEIKYQFGKKWNLYNSTRIGILVLN